MQAEAELAPDALVRLEHKIELKTKNERSYVNRPDLSTVKNLDGSIKKNTSFVRKLKSGITHDQLDTLSKELLSLKLEKYISEIVAAISEAKYRSSADIWAAVEICSLLHQRFAGFTAELVPALLKQLGPPTSTHGMSPEQKEKEESSRIAKQRSTLRLVADLYSVSIVKDTAKDSAMVTVLKEMFLGDKEQHVNLSIAVTFAKHYSTTFMDIKPRDHPPVSTDLEISDKSIASITVQDTLIVPDVKTAVKTIMVAYYKSLEAHLLREHTQIRKLERANHEHYIARGEINETRQDRYEKGLKAYEKLHSGTQTLAECLEQDFPDLPEDDSMTRLSIGITDGSGHAYDKDSSSGIWEDDDAKAFYENLIDLKNHVPAIFLGEKKERKEEVPEDAEAIALEDLTADTPASEDGEPGDNEKEGFVAGDPAEASEDEPEASGKGVTDDLDVEEDDSEEKKKGVSSANHAALEALLHSLPTAMNRDTIDQISIKFAFLNGKGARKKLIRTLLAVPRQRLDLLAYYGRLIATLYPYIPEVGNAVVEQLEKTFHGHQKRKEQLFIEDKNKNIRYIAELTKFRVAPLHVTFHCIKYLLERFKHHNIELLCTLLESCGRFLYKSPDTNVRASNYLDILMRKKNVENVDSRQVFMIENAFYQCNPPDRPASTAKIHTPIEQYVRNLIYSNLSKKTVEKTLKQLRKLNWDAPEIRHMMKRMFCRVWKVKFSHLHMMAFMASELSRYYPDFGIAVVDATLEEVRIGLEQNIFKHNQRRISTVKYLSELYNYRMIESALVFETMFRIVSFGHENNMPSPGVGTPLDAQHDFFRVRLCCTILDTCGNCFDRGSMAKRLDLFLAYFDMYINTKPRPPMDVDFAISETFELLRPKLVLSHTYEEAATAYSALATEQFKAAQNSAQNGIEEVSSDEDDEEIEKGGDRRGQTAVDDEEDEAYGDNKDIVEGDTEIDDDEAVIVHMQHDVDEEADEEFEREFSRMMQESLEGRRTDRKSAFDAPVPVRMKTTTNPLHEAPDIVEGEQVAFTLLTKKGNKQQAKTMALPADISFVINSRNKQEAEQEEKQHLKQLVLNYEEREQEAAHQAAVAQSSNTAWNGNGTGRVLLSTTAQRGGFYRGAGRGGGGRNPTSTFVATGSAQTGRGGRNLTLTSVAAGSAQTTRASGPRAT